MPFARALAPSMMDSDWLDDWDFPSRSKSWSFRQGLYGHDVSPTIFRGYSPFSRRQTSGGGISEVRTDEDKFQVALDVSHFAPEDITVKIVDKQVVVNAKHKEKADEHGFVSREFTRRYMLPPGIKPERVSATLNAKGMLTIEVPRKPLDAPKPTERFVPVTVQSSSKTTETKTQHSQQQTSEKVETEKKSEEPSQSAQ